MYTSYIRRVIIAPRNIRWIVAAIGEIAAADRGSQEHVSRVCNATVHIFTFCRTFGRALAARRRFYENGTYDFFVPDAIEYERYFRDRTTRPADTEKT